MSPQALGEPATETYSGDWLLEDMLDDAWSRAIYCVRTGRARKGDGGRSRPSRDSRRCTWRDGQAASAVARASRERWITVTTDELGEIARAYLHEDVEGRPVEMPSRQELVQLTAICLRALDDWDRNDDASEEAGNG